MDYGAGGTATTPTDYVAENGTITIPAGFSRTSVETSVSVNGDTTTEPDDTLRL